MRALGILQYIAVMLVAYCIDTLRYWFYSAMCYPKLNAAAWLIVVLLFNTVGWYPTFWYCGLAIGFIAYLVSPNVRDTMDVYIQLHKERYHDS
jgi:hypothetical protein